MSQQNFEQHPLAGSPQAQTEASSVFQATPERRVNPRGGVTDSQPINVPKLKEGFEHSSLTSVLGHESNEVQEVTESGFGPRLVVLHHYVTGPAIPTSGSDRAAFTRGDVIWGSQLIGDELMEKAQEGDENARAELRRYVRSGAVREASRQEASLSQVTFVEGEAALGTELERTQSRLAQTEDENTRMRRFIEALNLDPNMSEAELDAEVERLRIQTQGQETPPPVPPSAVAPTNVPNGETATEGQGTGEQPPPPY